MTHGELVDLSHKFVLKNMSCGFGVKELKTTINEIVDVLGFGAWNHSVLIEVKISRQDFLKDKNKPFRKNPERGVGKYRFYCCPKNLIKVEDLPNNWGLIWEDKGKLEIVYNPYCKNTKGNIFNGGFIYNKDAERAIMYSALRRKNKTQED
jgi:hypothetical protein